MKSSTDIAEILVVDDNEQNRALLSGHITLLGHNYREAEDGAQALEAMRESSPDLVLLDINMPVMDGMEVIEAMRGDETLSSIPVVVISGNDDILTISECIQNGADDYLVKPFQARILRARIENSLAKLRLRKKELALRGMVERYNEELQERVAAQITQISEAQLSTIFALSTLAESRDPETGAHLERIRAYCAVLGEEFMKTGPFTEQITSEYVEHLYCASPLHDIGKVGIPDNVLLKPGKLSDEEYTVMKTHAQIGADTLSRLCEKYPENGFLAMGYEIALNHHEKWDGTGYPNGISGTDIPLSARILALCDVYDALASKRCYKEAMPFAKCCSILLSEGGRHFDPAVLDGFERCASNFQEITLKYQG